jgi:hypothetical protein
MCDESAVRLDSNLREADVSSIETGPAGQQKNLQLAIIVITPQKGGETRRG